MMALSAVPTWSRMPGGCLAGSTLHASCVSIPSSSSVSRWSASAAGAWIPAWIDMLATFIGGVYPELSMFESGAAPVLSIFLPIRGGVCMTALGLALGTGAAGGTLPPICTSLASSSATFRRRLLMSSSFARSSWFMELISQCMASHSFSLRRPSSFLKVSRSSASMRTMWLVASWLMQLSSRSFVLSTFSRFPQRDPRRSWICRQSTSAGAPVPPARSTRPMLPAAAGPRFRGISLACSHPRAHQA
mmetsp:Transcript_56862/g.166958  ORF Transcript_56862/g.166958 Transcript_56862/m.166958 type:complete len:247 (-) Transcript_56862:14-754(-)